MDNLNIVQKVLEKANVGAALFDKEGRICWVNEKLSLMLGRSCDSLYQTHFKSFTYSEDVEESLELYDKLVSGALTSFESTTRYYHGVSKRIVWVEINVSIYPKEKEDVIFFTIAIVKNITHRVRQVGRLRAASKDLERFAYAASHDLKQPLRIISVFADLLRNKYFDTLDEKGKEYIKRIKENAMKSAELIEELLSFSRAGVIVEKVHPVDVLKVIKKIVKYFKTIQKEEIELEYLPFSAFVEVVPSHLESLIMNLISNSIKFRKPNQLLKIRVTHLTYLSNEIFWIWDNGIGINPSFENKLFEPFKYYHPSGQTGVGMGLAICKRVATLYEGKLENLPSSEGACFKLTLPRKSSFNNGTKVTLSGTHLKV